MEQKVMKVEYMKKKEINFNAENASKKAVAVLEKAGDEENLVLKVSINSPVYIEDAAPLTPDGILSICKEE